MESPKEKAAVITSWYNWKIRSYMLVVNLVFIGLALLISYYFGSKTTKLGEFMLAGVMVAFPTAQMFLIKTLPKVIEKTRRY